MSTNGAIAGPQILAAQKEDVEYDKSVSRVLRSSELSDSVSGKIAKGSTELGDGQQPSWKDKGKWRDVSGNTGGDEVRHLVQQGGRD